ncbi:unnamed protein product [Blepharisma stoltei]|uniref:Uncharacterized protein n=1 Tax=Blepharisma stoltei TaxID=1481888 RepID=A0AAU9IDH1_9CILI|nr:unnamed protein product [Blepharisma stoltei]
MARNFNPLLFETLNVGKHIKSSKKRFMWKFELDGKEHVIDLFLSKISGKRKILLNGDIKIEAKRSSSSYGSYPLRIGSHSLLLFELEGNIFDLRCDNISFEAALMRNRSKSDFTGGYRDREPRGDTYSGGNWDEQYRSRGEASELYGGRTDYNIDTYKTSSRWEKAEEPEDYRSSRIDQFKAEWEENKRWERKEREEEEEYRNYPKYQSKRRQSPDPLPRASVPQRNERVSVPSPPKQQISKSEPKVESPPPKPLDLLDAPPVQSSLPDDLFTKPLQSSANQNPLGNPYSMSSNPFESDPSTEESPFGLQQSSSQEQTSQPPLIQPQPEQKPDFDHFIDLDNLHLGDGYSPAVARKIQEANKPITINNPNVPNVPLNQLLTNRPQQNPAMNTMAGMNPMNPMNPMNNPMAAMMAYNQFMTGMMMNPYMNPQQPCPK